MYRENIIDNSGERKLRFSRENLSANRCVSLLRTQRRISFSIHPIFSFGRHVATQTINSVVCCDVLTSIVGLVQRSTPAALIIESGFSSVPSMAKRIYPFLPISWLTSFEYDTKKYVKVLPVRFWLHTARAMTSSLSMKVVKFSMPHPKPNSF